MKFKYFTIYWLRAYKGFDNFSQCNKLRFLNYTTWNFHLTF